MAGVNGVTAEEAALAIIGRATYNDKKTIKRQLARLVDQNLATKQSGKLTSHGQSPIAGTHRRSPLGQETTHHEPVDKTTGHRRSARNGQAHWTATGQRVIHPCQSHWTGTGQKIRQPLDTPAPSLNKAGVQCGPSVDPETQNFLHRAA
jgi:hypothetical protein